MDKERLDIIPIEKILEIVKDVHEGDMSMENEEVRDLISNIKLEGEITVHNELFFVVTLYHVTCLYQKVLDQWKISWSNG